MRIADQLNELRIIPRLLIGMYGVSFWKVMVWFMNLPDPTPQQATFVNIIIGAGAAFFGLYVNSGKK